MPNRNFEIYHLDWKPQFKPSDVTFRLQPRLMSIALGFTVCTNSHSGDQVEDLMMGCNCNWKAISCAAASTGS